MTRLQVMICTFGKEGIARVTASSHPIVDGVEYLVGWQLPDGDAEIPMELIERPDFHIFKEKSRGYQETAISYFQKLPLLYY